MQHEQPRKLRVLVADDNDDVRRAIITILQQAFDIVGEVTSGRALVEAAPRLAPDVVVSDVLMPLLTGVEAMHALRTAGHTPPFVLVTTDTENALEWINLGALGVVNKLNMPTELVIAVRSAAAGFSYLSSYARRSY